MGRAAARRVARWMRQAIARHRGVTMMFAAAPSQREFLMALGQMDRLDWSRVTALQMDEYLGLAANSTQTLGAFLKKHLYDVVRPGTVHYLEAAATPSTECRRYADLLARHPLEILCAGIGENGHLAFNDPPADFEDPDPVRIVALDGLSRAQQVRDGQFPAIDDVPTHALTVTIPALMRATRVSCVVPGPTKAAAVRAALREPISPDCPASVLRRHRRAVLYLDEEAAALLDVHAPREVGADPE